MRSRMADRSILGRSWGFGCWTLRRRSRICSSGESLGLTVVRSLAIKDLSCSMSGLSETGLATGSALAEGRVTLRDAMLVAEEEEVEDEAAVVVAEAKLARTAVEMVMRRKNPIVVIQLRFG